MAASAIAAANPDSTDATARSSAASAFEATAGTDPAESTDATTGAETGIAAASDVGTATETNQTVREEQDSGVVSGNRDTSQLGSQGRELGQIVDQFA